MPSSNDLQECIDACRRCHALCAQTISHCLEKGGHHASLSHIRLLIDCTEICQTSADFMLRGSEMHHATCSACAEICERCASDCDQMADDPRMRECAETCRACASICREMAGSHETAPVETYESRSPDQGEYEAPRPDEIAALAQQLYEDDGRPEGRDQVYWFRAERQLRERYEQHAPA